MKTIVKLIIIIVVNSTAYSQEYTITTDPISNYTIDRYTNEIYYKQYYRDLQDVYKTDFDGSYHIKTDFSSAPVFAHNSHKGIILEWTERNIADYFIYDFETNEKKFLFNTRVSLGLSFSWNDSLVFIYGAENTGQIYNPRLAYYSFIDSTLHYEDIRIYPNYSIAWHKDNDKIIYSTDDNILTYSISNNKFDTLVSTENYDKIISFSYHPGNNILAYSLEENSYYDTNYVYSLNLSDSSKNMLFKAYYTPGSCGDCHSGPITQMVWNIEGNLLSFTSEPYLVSVVNIYLYNHDIDTTFQFVQYNEGFVYQLKWLDKRRIAYKNATYGHKLMGYQYDKPLPVKETLNDDYTINLSCYPNPFNPTTVVRYVIPKDVRGEKQEVRIVVYNTLGQEVAVLVNRVQSAGSYEAKFRAKNLPSGIYFINLTAKTKTEISRQTIKSLLIK